MLCVHLSLHNLITNCVVTITITRVEITNKRKSLINESQLLGNKKQAAHILLLF